MIARDDLGQGIGEVTQLTAQAVDHDDRRALALIGVMQARALDVDELPVGRHLNLSAAALPLREHSQSRACRGHGTRPNTRRA